MEAELNDDSRQQQDGSSVQVLDEFSGNAMYGGLFGGGNSDGQESDEERQPLSEADRRRQENKRRCKNNQKKITDEEKEYYKLLQEQKRRDAELKKKNKKLWDERGLGQKGYRRPKQKKKDSNQLFEEDKFNGSHHNAVNSNKDNQRRQRNNNGQSLAYQKQMQQIQEREQFLTIMNEVKEDVNFQAFYQKYLNLQKVAVDENQEILRKVPGENDYGNCEYKLKFDNPSMNRVDHLTTQMIFRLNEGFGRAIYRIGVDDSGVVLGISEDAIKETLMVLFYMARNQNAKIMVEKVVRAIQESCFMAEISIQRNILEDLKQGIKITMLGCEAAGKSTLIGVLISGQKDDGKGLARVHVHKHYAEILDGKTTSMYQHILGFNSSGEVTNLSKFGTLSWPQIMEESTKVITFIDVGGNEKYAKTLTRGLCVHYPDYALIVIDAQEAASKGGKISKNVLDNFRIAFAFQVCVIIVLTKIDCVQDKELLDDVVYELRLQIWEIANRVGNVIHNKKDIVLINRQMQSQIVCPIFLISCKTLEGVDLFKNFLSNLQFSNTESNIENEAYGGEFHVSRTFKKDKNHILAGIVHKGKFRQNQKTLLGPNNEGTFTDVEIKSIHCNGVPVISVRAGQMCSILIKLQRFHEKWLQNAGGEIRKGMVLLDFKDGLGVEACYSFKAEFWSYDDTPYTIKSTFQPFIHTQQVSQTGIIFLENDIEMARYNLSKRQKNQKKKRGKSTEQKVIQNPETSQDYLSSDNNKEEEKIMSEEMENNPKPGLKTSAPMGLFLSPNFNINKLKNVGSQNCMSEGRQRSYSSQEDLTVQLQTHQNSLTQKQSQLQKMKESPDNTQQKVKEKHAQNAEEITILPDQKTTLIVQFLYNPEYLGLGNKIIINMDNLKAFGKITQLIPEKIDNSIQNSTSRTCKNKTRSRAGSQKSNEGVVQNIGSLKPNDRIKSAQQILMQNCGQNSVSSIVSESQSPILPNKNHQLQGIPEKGETQAEMDIQLRTQPVLQMPALEITEQESLDVPTVPIQMVKKDLSRITEKQDSTNSQQ